MSLNKALFPRHPPTPTPHTHIAVCCQPWLRALRSRSSFHHLPLPPGHLAFHSTENSQWGPFCSLTLASEARHWAIGRGRESLGGLVPITVTSQQGWDRGRGDISERKPYRPQCFCTVDGKECLLRKGLSFMGAPCSGLGETALRSSLLSLRLPTPVLDGTCSNLSVLLGKQP